VGGTVSDSLVAAGFDPSSGIEVSPSPEAPLVPGMTITAADVFLRLLDEQRPLAPKSRTIEDPTLPVGTKRLISQGSPGRLLRVLETVVVGGQERGRVLKAERVLTPATDTVVAVGTRRDFRGNDRIPRLFTATDYFAPVGGRRLTVLSTAYAPNAASGGPRAATGALLGYGIIAVDPDVIPLGSQVYVPGYGYAIAADTGGAIKGRRIDVCFESERRVDRWGVRTVTITILQ
jgi:3D (Asp-Asp-Asp) domain-containing protein